MIRNLIFDVGGVLIGYRWEEMLEDHGITKKRALEVGELVFTDPTWTRFDSGLISFEEMVAYYESAYPEYKEDIDYFLNNSELMRVDLPQVWERVEKLHQRGYKLYILSNYSKVLFEKHTKGASFLEQMDGGIISYQVKLVKPDSRIYQALLSKYDLIGEECLFFDDRKDNVEAAIKEGIQAFQVIDTEMFVKKLDSLLAE